jgi:PAS domain-containing protein
MVEKIMDGFCKEILKSLNNSALGVILIDPLGKIIWVNKTDCDYSGLPRKKLIGDFAQKLNLFEKSSTEDIAKNLSLGELKNKESFTKVKKLIFSIGTEKRKF